MKVNAEAVAEAKAVAEANAEAKANAEDDNADAQAEDSVNADADAKIIRACKFEATGELVAAYVIVACAIYPFSFPRQRE